MLTPITILLCTFLTANGIDVAIARYHAGLTGAGHLWAASAAVNGAILFYTLYSLRKAR